MPILTSVIFDPYFNPPEFDLATSLVLPEVSRRSKTGLNKAHLKTISIIPDESVDVQNVVNDLLLPKPARRERIAKNVYRILLPRKIKAKRQSCQKNKI